MTLREVHNVVTDRLSRLAFETIWPGFTPSPFALYDDQNVCFADRTLPKDDAFLGCTAIQYEGAWLAIWRLEEGDACDPDNLAANLVHEMFHAHQLLNGEQRFPNEFEALRIPEDPAYFQDQYREAWSLRRAWDAWRAGEPGLARQCLRTLAEQRQCRQARNEAAFRYGLCAETLEGSAEYCCLRALCMLSPGQYERRIDRALDWMTQPGNILDQRRYAYFFGALSMLLLEALGIGFSKALGVETLFWEDAAQRLRGEDSPNGLEAVRMALEARLQEQASTLASVTENAPCIEGDFRLACFDPMNWFAMEDRIYHKTFVKLLEGPAQRELLLHGPAVTWHDPKDLFRVYRYVAAHPAPREKPPED